MHKKGVKILKARIGLSSNNPGLLPELPLKPKYESLLTDYHKVEEIEYSKGLDSYFFIEDVENIPPKIEVSAREIRARGPFARLTREALDLRFAFFGNEGLLYRYALTLLENNYQIYSFHACALYEEEKKRMFVIPGGAGSGKTCLILKGLELGLKIFSVEMVHFKVQEKGVLFYKGALVDNIRIGNLKYSYPAVLKRLKVQLPETSDEWGKKIAVNLSQFQTDFEEVLAPELVIIFPRIEESKPENKVMEVKDRRKLTKLLFDNISQKIGETILLYETIPLEGLDTPLASEKRLENTSLFLERGRIERALNVIGGAQNCWEGVL